MAHLDRDFPRNVAAGCSALLTRRSTVVSLASGREERNAHWKRSRRSWAAGLAVRSAADLGEVLDLFEEANGRLHSFRFQDWLDWSSAPPGDPVSPHDQPLGLGDGDRATFQMVKRYGAARPYLREIALPRASTVAVAVDGVMRPGGWRLSAGGRITFDTPPAPGVSVSAGFKFDVPVRFDADDLAAQWAYFDPDGDGIAQAPDIPLIEVRL